MANQAYKCAVNRYHKDCGLPVVVVIRWDDGLEAGYCAKHRSIADSWIRTTKVVRTIWELQRATAKSS